MTKARILLAGLIITECLLVWFAPAERTIGDGIKAVYIHVSLTWAGMVGFTLAGILGLLNLTKFKANLREWIHIMIWVAFGCYAFGFIMSLAAAKITWGAVLWQEPRVVFSLLFLTLAFLIQMINRWVLWHKMQDAIIALLLSFLMWFSIGTPLVFHPSSPIKESTSLAIQLTFLGMFVLSSLVAAWFVWYLRMVVNAKKLQVNYGRRPD